MNDNHLNKSSVLQRIPDVAQRDVINKLPGATASLSNIFNSNTSGINAELRELNLLKGAFVSPDKSLKEILLFRHSFAREHIRNSTYPFFANGSACVLKILDAGLKKSFRKAQETADIHGQEIIQKSSIQKLTRPLSKIDYSIANSITKGKPLTKKMLVRLDKLEAAGYVKLETLNNDREKISALKKHRDKLVLSKYDIELIRNCKNGNQEKINQKRLERLSNEGYLVSTQKGHLNVAPKFTDTAHNLILKKHLDLREEYTISTQPIKYTHTNTPPSREERPVLKRKLNEDQVNSVLNIYNFCNMTKGQLYSLHQRAGREIYFEKDIAALKKKGIMESEDRCIDGKKVQIYNLKYTGNKIAQSLVGKKLSQTENTKDMQLNTGCEDKVRAPKASKKYTKNNSELLHDLLQFEAVQYFKKDLESKGSTITDITIDRHKRSQIYDGISIRENGGITEKIVDVELEYETSAGDVHTIPIEIDRHYKAEVIRSKSSCNPPMVWVTDSHKQYNRISKNIASKRFLK